MAEPTNTGKRKLMDVKKGKIIFQHREAGELGDFPDVKAPDNCQDMDLKKVDNENRGSYNGEKIAKLRADDKNVDFNKLHNDFRPIVDSKKPANAGK